MESGVPRLVVTAPAAHQARAPRTGVGPLGRTVSRRVVARLGWSACGVAIAAAGLGWLLLLASGSRADRGHGGDPVQDMAFPVFATVGALIVSRRTANAIGWLCCAIGLLSSLGLNGLGYGYVHYALAGPGGGLPGAVWVAWLSEWLNDLSFGLGPLVLLLFPTGRPPSAAWRPAVWGALGLAGVAALLDAVRPGPLVNFPFVDNPLGLSSQLVLFASDGVGLIEVVLFLVGAASVFVRLGSARGVEQQQIKWFAYATSLVVAGVVLVIALPDLLGLDVQHLPPWLRLLGTEFWGLAIVAIPVAIGIAILRYRLYDIDLLINRTLVYAGLTAAIVGLYVLVVGYLGLLFQARGDLSSLLAAGLTAVLFQPLRQRLQFGVNRLLYGQRDEPYAVLSRLGQRLENTLAAEAVLPTIVEIVREALKLPYVGLAVRSADGERVGAEAGSPAPVALRVDLPYQQGVVGALLLGARSTGEAFTSADQRLLHDLARHAGVAVHAVALTTELQRARERLVAAHEEERRRLRRDLHDGLGPRLASLGLQLAALRNALGHEPPLQARAEALKEQTLEAVEDVRRLVDGLRPPALDELGLVDAIEQQAARYGDLATDVRVTVAAPRLPALPAAVEVAAYRIVSEALTNCVRHADATVCCVRLALSVTGAVAALEVEVTDDGKGFRPGPRVGTGLLSMRERAAELGGTCSVETRPEGGTRVLARLPLAGGAR